MHVDGASNAKGAGAELSSPILMARAGEYHATITRLELARTLGVSDNCIRCNSQLIINQIKGDYTAKETNMAAYLTKGNKELEAFSWYEITQVPRSKNVEADALSRLTSGISKLS